MSDYDPLQTDRPHSARMYDHWLGGKDNYAADREAADAVARQFPLVPMLARTNRHMMLRAVEYIVGDAGVSQLLDIGTGIPTQPNVHQIAQAHNPAARVVYVDNDLLVAAHARALLKGTETGVTRFVHGDLTDPESILTSLPATLDLTQPVAVLLFAVLHFLADEQDPYRIVRTLMDPLPSGSILAITHATSHFNPDEAPPAIDEYRRQGIYLADRNFSQFAHFFKGLNLVEPGIVGTTQWKPPIAVGRDFNRIAMWAGVAVKP